MFESMHKFVLEKHFVVRVWREEEKMESPFYPWGDLESAAHSANKLQDRAAISACFEKCERVTAVEVLDQYGNGSVVYTVWP
jgi:hypothetical protein